MSLDHVVGHGPGAAVDYQNRISGQEESSEQEIKDCKLSAYPTNRSGGHGFSRADQTAKDAGFSP
jgi:hypothetical protein